VHKSPIFDTGPGDDAATQEREAEQIVLDRLASLYGQVAHEMAGGCDGVACVTDSWKSFFNAVKSPLDCATHRSISVCGTALLAAIGGLCAAASDGGCAPFAEEADVAAETTTEGVDVGAMTAHGAERVAGAGATRGGVLTPEQIVQVRGTGQLWSQADGASVHVLQNGAGRYDVVVDGDRGLITTFNNLSQKSFDRLANSYGWTQ
jgi:hypothetical protein